MDRLSEAGAEKLLRVGLHCAGDEPRARPRSRLRKQLIELERDLELEPDVAVLNIDAEQVLNLFDAVSYGVVVCKENLRGVISSLQLLSKYASNVRSRLLPCS
ncbi:MAG: hypothetical protein R2912_12185 [Eubacteriales bacterium]